MYWNQGPTPPPQAPQHMYQYPLMAQRFNNPPITNPAKRCQRQPYAGANQSFGSQMPMMPDFIEQKLMDMKKLPEIYLFDFENPGLDKKWSSPREDITDYFNYGFTEETWRIYAEKVKNLHEQVQPCPKPDKSQRVLGYTPPIDIGGFGEPYFPEAKDTPFMKVVNRNKESVMYMLSKNPYHSLEILLERALLDPRVIPVEQSLRKLYDEIKPGMLTLKRKLPMEYLSFLAQSQNITAGAECAYTPKYNPLRSKPAPQPKALLPAPASSSTHTPPTNPTPPIPPTPATPPQLPKSSSTPTPKPSTPPPNPTRPTPTLPPKPFPRSPKPFSHHPQPQTHQPQPHHHQSIDISSLALILSMRDRLIAKSMIDDNNDTCDDDVRRKRRLSTSSSSSSVMRKGKGKRSTGSSSSSSSSSGGSKGSGRKSDRSGSKGDKKGREAGKGEVKRNERRERQGEGKKEGERDRKREEEVKKKDAEKKAVIREHEREDRGSGSTKKRRRGRGRDKGQKNGHDNLDRRRRSNDKKDSRRSKEKSDIKKDKVNKDERTGQKDHKRRENESHTHSGRDNRIGENELSVKRKKSSKQKRSSREKTENKSQRSDEFRLEKPKVAKKNQIDEKEAHLGKRSEFLDDNEKSVSQKPKLKMKRNRSESSSRESSRSHRNRNDKDTNKKPTKSSAHASSSQLPSNSNRKVRDEDHHQDRHNPKTSNSSKGESSIHERINPKPVPQTQSSTFKKPIKPVHHKRR